MIDERFTCTDGLHNCYNVDQTCGCPCMSCWDDTEPRCETCNAILDLKETCPDCEVTQ